MIEMEVLADTVVLLNDVRDICPSPRFLLSCINEKPSLNFNVVRDKDRPLDVLEEVVLRKQTARLQSIRSQGGRA